MALPILACRGPCGFIRCVNEKMKKTARPVSESSAFDGRVLLGLDGLGLVPISQRHVASGSRAGVWLIGCEIECVLASWRPLWGW